MKNSNEKKICRDLGVDGLNILPIKKLYMWVMLADLGVVRDEEKAQENI